MANSPERREKNLRAYRRHREKILTRVRSRNLRVRSEIRDAILGYLTTHPCVDCGENDPIVLDFDHVAEKSFGISVARSRCYPVERVLAEIEKCEVRCANCHRRKTYRDRGHSSRGEVVPSEGRERGGEAETPNPDHQSDRRRG